MTHRRPGGRACAFLVALAMTMALSVSVAGPVGAMTPRPVRLEAGPHTGYTFSSTWTVIGTKTVTLAGPLKTTADDRRWISGRTYLRVTGGPLAGRYVRESAVAHIPGLIATKTFVTPTRVAFGAGTYLGYRFDAAWGLASTKRGVLVGPSGALAARRVLIDGRPYAEMVSGTWAGYWIPLVSPTVLTASGITCSVPAHVPAGASQVFRVLPGAGRQVALTFDMGGRMTPAVDILERLVIDRVCSTIFPTGTASLDPTGQRVLAIIRAHPELFEVGNHTMHHCNLRDGGGGAACPTTPPTAAFIGRELTGAAAIIRAASGRNPAPYWRPPYGAYDSRVRTAAAAVGYTKTFMWDIDTIDWRPVNALPTPGPTAAQIADKVMSRAVVGSVVLMHLGGYNTFDALPSMVLRLRAAGLMPTTVSDILR